jgi:hypothetical protein
MARAKSLAGMLDVPEPMFGTGGPSAAALPGWKAPISMVT